MAHEDGCPCLLEGEHEPQVDGETLVEIAQIEADAEVAVAEIEAEVASEQIEASLEHHEIEADTSIEHHEIESSHDDEVEEMVEELAEAVEDLEETLDEAVIVDTELSGDGEPTELSDEGDLDADGGDAISVAPPPRVEPPNETKKAPRQKMVGGLRRGRR